MDPDRYDVFISYRRSDGSELAQLIRNALVRRGLRVFLDVRELGAGHFDTALLRHIEVASDFILLLTPGSLDRAVRPDDWLRREVEHALGRGRNIVPVMARGFEFPTAVELPGGLAELVRHHCVRYDHDYSDESIDRLYRMLTAGRGAFRRVRRGFLVGSAVLAMAAAGLVWALAGRPGLPPANRPDSRAESLPPLALYWYGFGQRSEDGRWTEFRVQDGMTMHSGDQFRLVLSPNQDSYAYVIGLDPNGRTTVLFPNEAIGTDNRLRAGERYEIPDALNWFQLDDQVGTETLYLLASYDPLTSLDSLLRTRARGPGGPGGPAGPEVERHIARLERPATDGDQQTRDGRVVLRGVGIRPDRRVATARLASGQEVERVMEFQSGGVSVIKRIRIAHLSPP
ncbi:MAG: DUF4384 domain-containing protein [Gemmatimonadales bacterium]